VWLGQLFLIRLKLTAERAEIAERKIEKLSVLGGFGG
jgi:hypothetical protein